MLKGKEERTGHDGHDGGREGRRREHKNRRYEDKKKERTIGDYSYLLRRGEETTDLDGEDTTLVIDSDEEEYKRTMPRKRGRLPTRRTRIERERIREEREKYELMDRRRTLTGRKGRMRSDMEEGRISELKENPTTDLSAEVLEQAALINNVADISKNLKGTSVKILREAAATIKAAVTIMSDRWQGENRYDGDKDIDNGN